LLLSFKSQNFIDSIVLTVLNNFFEAVTTTMKWQFKSGIFYGVTILQ